jgi:hypothetical protein
MLKISDWREKYIGKEEYQLYRKGFQTDSAQKVTNTLLYIGS